MRKGWTNKKAKRVSIAMSWFWYCTLGLYGLGRLSALITEQPPQSLIGYWVMGFIVSFFGAWIIVLASLVIEDILEWRNDG